MKQARCRDFLKDSHDLAHNYNFWNNKTASDNHYKDSTAHYSESSFDDSSQQVIEIRFWFNDQENHLEDKQSLKKMTKKMNKKNMNQLLCNLQQKKEKAIKADVTNSLKTDKDSIYRSERSLKIDEVNKTQRNEKSDFHFSSIILWWNFSFETQQQGRIVTNHFFFDFFVSRSQQHRKLSVLRVNINVVNHKVQTQQHHSSDARQQDL